MKRILTVFLLLCFFVVPAFAADTAKSNAREPNVEIWLPPDFRSSEGPWPLIIFSHGFGGCAKQSTFLTSYWAEQGYIVAAPDHADAIPCKNVAAYLNANPNNIERTPERPFREPMQWSDETYITRKEDILFTLSSMLDDPMYKGYIDEDNIGLAGFSLGGYTVLGLTGGWPSWADKRFKAVLAMSPYANPYIVRKGLSRINVPIFYMGGTKDSPVTPIIKKMGWGQTTAPKYFLELEGGQHISFSERDPRFKDLISQTSLAFFDKYLRGRPANIDPGKVKGMAIYWQEERQGGKP